MKTLEFLERKKIRADVIATYIKNTGIRGVVCFSCGNASAALKNIPGLYVVDISKTGDLKPNRWWSCEEIRKCWPDLFDATSGHLPLWMMARIAESYYKFIGHLPSNKYLIPTGSGETIICLRLAYPNIEFNPIYNIGCGTEYNENAPLNKAVEQPWLF